MNSTLLVAIAIAIFISCLVNYYKVYKKLSRRMEFNHKNLIKAMENLHDDNMGDSVYTAIAEYRMYVHLDEKNEVNTTRRYIGYVEVLTFSIIACLVFSSPLKESFKLLLECLGGWFAIKSLGTFKYWENPFIGRALFYKYLLGTMLSVGMGIWVGLFSLAAAHVLIGMGQ